MISDELARKRIAVNVRRLRAGRSKGWLARAVGIGTISVTRIEDAQHLPGSGLLARLAEALECTTDDLLAARKKLSRAS